jgi:hypothetical protein
MADVLGSIFGSGQRTTQTQRPDPLAQEFNALRLGLTGQIFNQAGMDQYAAARPDIYRPSDRSEYLWQSASRALDDAGNVDTGQFMSFDDYMNRGYDATDRSYRTALESTSDAYEMGRGSNRAALDTARGNLWSTTAAGREVNRAGYDTARGAIASGRDRALGDIYGATGFGLNQANISGERALGRLDTAFDTSYDKALGQTEGYINQIATPAAMQAATLQGLEGGGAVPAAIARATAEYGGNLLGPLLQQYLSGVTGVAGAQQGQEGALLSGLQGGITGIGNTALGAEASLGGQYLSQEGQLLQQLLGAEAALGGQYLGQEGSLGQGYLSSITGLGGQYMNNLGQFVGSLPGASTQLGLAPFQARQMATDTALTRANAAMSLFPMADFGRSLQEQDFLRRQGLAQTALTGIPFTPGSSTSQRQSSQPLFNFFGQG